MGQLIKAVHYFDDGTETTYEFNKGQISPADAQESVDAVQTVEAVSGDLSSNESATLPDTFE